MIEALWFILVYLVFLSSVCFKFCTFFSYIFIWVKKIVFLITCPGRDFGLNRVVDASRCKRLLENVVVTFMDVAVSITSLSTILTVCTLEDNY